MAVLAIRERAPRRILALLFVGQASSILVGLESEKRRLPGKIMNFMAALELSLSPRSR